MCVRMNDEDAPEETSSDIEAVPDEGRSDREQNLHQIILRIERLFITGGLRMDFLTPAVLLIVLGSSVAYADSTPTWWDGGLEEQFGVELSVFLLLISGFIIIANIFLIFILFLSLRLNISMFDEHERAMSEQGMTMTNSQGYAEVRRIFDVTKRILRGRTFVLLISLVLVALSLIPLIDDYRTPLSMLALSSILASLGLQITAPLRSFNTLEPWGLLDSYQPAVHKTLLSDPFLDLVRAHADPLLHTRMSLHLGDIARRLPDLDMVSFQERLLHLLHLRASTAIDDGEMRRRLSKYIDQDIMDELFDHPELGETTWVRLLSHSAIACPPFFRLYDRLRRQQVGNSFEDVWFDVDIENLARGRTNLMAFILNRGKSDIDLILRVQTPDFRPKEGVYRLTVPPAKLSAKDDVESQIEAMGESMIVWQSLIPSVFGEATVSIRLENTEGSLVNGRVLNVQSRADLTTRFRRSLGSAMIVTAIFTALIPAISAISAILPSLS